MEIFLSVLVALLSIMNPLGTVPIFVGLTQEHSKAQRSKIALSTAIAVLVILLISFIAGHHLLLFFGISISPSERNFASALL